MTGGTPVRETQFSSRKAYVNTENELKDEEDDTEIGGIKGKLNAVRKLFWKIF
jgi:hypothetical protein